MIVLVLGFAVLAAGRWRPLAYAAQCLAVALAALLAGHYASAVLLVLQAGLLGLVLDRAPRLPDVPGWAIWTGPAAVVLALVAAPPAAAPALATLLLGLLAAGAGGGPWGPLCLLNGAALAATGAPVLVAALAGLAALAIGRPVLAAPFWAPLWRWRA